MDNDNKVKSVIDAFQRWYDPIDFPEDATIELSTLLAGYMTMELMYKFSYVEKLSILMELAIAIFNLGRAHAHEEIK